MEEITILGIRISLLTRESFFQKIPKIIDSGKKAKIMYANIHVINSSYQYPELKSDLNAADIVYCDGEGVRLGAKISGKNLPERMTGADWINDLSFLCQKKRYSLYFLGGEPGVANLAAENLKKKYPEIIISGTHHGFFSCSPKENEKLLSEVNRKSPRIILVGLGTPLQEKWIRENSTKLNASITWAIGGLFGLIAGTEKRAPEWMTKSGLEWLFRLFTQPKRMCKRYLLGNPLFFFRIIKSKFNER